MLSLPVSCERLLLHSCCAPCSGAIIECLLHNGIRPAIFFSNSNITPFAEYEKRRDEIERYARENSLEFINDDYDHLQWVQGDAQFEGCGSQGLRGEPERGERCLQCFKFRLLRAARYAAANGYDILATSLASSRWKDLSQVDEAGRWACSQVSGVTFWAQNWRKGGLQERRSQIIREQGFYNQLFCGCEFSPRKDY
ncbi:MAG: epoxyqueuosine reductase QueH [Bacteroidales bacterium]|nr:epoxyqueuosine reductase QueH [Candidatus Cryptobacteroides fimicaballi]